MLKPVMVLGSIIAAALLSLVLVRSCILIDAHGQPFDALGNPHTCQLCGNGRAHEVGPYLYRCDQCGRRYKARTTEAGTEVVEE